jgi:hypothetical protein
MLEDTPQSFDYLKGVFAQVLCLSIVADVTQRTLTSAAGQVTC